MKITAKLNNGDYFSFSFLQYMKLPPNTYWKTPFLNFLASLEGDLYSVYCLRNNAASKLETIQNNNERIDKTSRNYNKKHMNSKQHAYNIHSLEELSIVKDSHLYNDKEHHFGELIERLKEERKYNFLDHSHCIHSMSDSFQIDTTDTYGVLDYMEQFTANELYIKEHHRVMIWRKLHLSTLKHLIQRLLTQMETVMGVSMEEHLGMKVGAKDFVSPHKVDEMVTQLHKYFHLETVVSSVVVEQSKYMEWKESILFLVMVYKALLVTKQPMVACIFTYNK